LRSAISQILKIRVGGGNPGETKERLLWESG
jgi:hypothetical protein